MVRLKGDPVRSLWDPESKRQYLEAVVKAFKREKKENDSDEYDSEDMEEDSEADTKEIEREQPRDRVRTRRTALPPPPPINAKSSRRNTEATNSSSSSETGEKNAIEGDGRANRNQLSNNGANGHLRDSSSGRKRRSSASTRAANGAVADKLDREESENRFQHPLENHEKMPAMTDMQRIIAEAIMKKGVPCTTDDIYELVAPRWSSLRRRDGSSYTSDNRYVRRAILANLRPNPNYPNLFRRDLDHEDCWINCESIEEALGSMEGKDVDVRDVAPRDDSSYRRKRRRRDSVRNEEKEEKDEKEHEEEEEEQVEEIASAGAKTASTSKRSELKKNDEGKSRETPTKSKPHTPKQEMDGKEQKGEDEGEGESKHVSKKEGDNDSSSISSQEEEKGEASRKPGGKKRKRSRLEALTVGLGEQSISDLRKVKGKRNSYYRSATNDADESRKDEEEEEEEEDDTASSKAHDLNEMEMCDDDELMEDDQQHQYVPFKTRKSRRRENSDNSSTMTEEIKNEDDRKGRKRKRSRQSMSAESDNDDEEEHYSSHSSKGEDDADDSEQNDSKCKLAAALTRDSRSRSRSRRKRKRRLSDVLDTAPSSPSSPSATRAKAESIEQDANLERVVAEAIRHNGGQCHYQIIMHWVQKTWKPETSTDNDEESSEEESETSALNSEMHINRSVMSTLQKPMFARVPKKVGWWEMAEGYATPKSEDDGEEDDGSSPKPRKDPDELTDLQVLIVEAIAECGGKANLDDIVDQVSKKWGTLRRRDGTRYAANCTRAVMSSLANNPQSRPIFKRYGPATTSGRAPSDSLRWGLVRRGVEHLYQNNPALLRKLPKSMLQAAMVPLSAVPDHSPENSDGGGEEDEEEDLKDEEEEEGGVAVARRHDERDNSRTRSRRKDSEEVVEQNITLTDMQRFIINLITKCGGSCSFDVILEEVTKNRSKLRRRDGSSYSSDMVRAVKASLSNNTYAVPIFKKEPKGIWRVADKKCNYNQQRGVQAAMLRTQQHPFYDNPKRTSGGHHRSRSRWTDCTCLYLCVYVRTYCWMNVECNVIFVSCMRVWICTHVCVQARVCSDTVNTKGVI